MAVSVILAMDIGSGASLWRMRDSSLKISPNDTPKKLLAMNISASVSLPLRGSPAMPMMRSSSILFDVVVEFLRVFVLAKFGKRFCLNLADTLTGNAEFLPYFFERMALAVFQPEAQLKDLLFALGEAR